MDAEGESTERIAASIHAERSRDGGETRSVLAGCAGQIVAVLAAAGVAYGLLGALSLTAQSAAFLVLLAIGQFVATLVITASVIKIRVLGLVLALLPLLIIGSIAGMAGSEDGSIEYGLILAVMASWVFAIGITVAGYVFGRRWRWRAPVVPKRRAMDAATRRLEQASSDWRRPSFMVRYDDTEAGRLEMTLDRRFAEARGFRVEATVPKGPSRLDALLSFIASLASLFQGGTPAWNGEEPTIEVTYRRSGR
jgi:hypothetical protein